MELQKLIDGLKAHKSGAASYESVDEAIRVFEAMRDVDGEKVCKGLECHAQVGTCGKDCPYFAPGCSEPLCADALTLIRQQQTRIVELEMAIAGWEKHTGFLAAHGVLKEEKPDE